MPFKLPQLSGKGSHEQNKAQEPSVDDLLPDTEHKVELILLVELCTQHMRGAFQVGDGPRHDEKSKRDTSTTLTDQPIESHRQPKGQAQERSTWGQPWESNSARLANLEQAGLAHFDTWHETVVRRMSEALKVKLELLKAARSHYNADAAADLYEAQVDNRRSEVEVSLPFPRVRLPDRLAKLDEKKRALVLGAVLFILISLEHYSAQSRTLIAYLCRSFDLPHDVLSSEETTTAATLLDAAAKSDSSIDAEDARKKHAEQGSVARKWKIGLATVAGAAVIGITGGLAAPLMIGLGATVLGGVGLGGLATLLGATIINPVTIGALFGALGARMTGRAMERYSKEVEDFKFVPLSDVRPALSKPSQESEAASMPAHKLRVVIGVSGWLTEPDDVHRPFRVLSTTTCESFALRYELAALTSLGTTLDEFLKNSAYSYAQSHAIKLILPQLAAALAPVGLLKSGKFIDNPFSIAMTRSDKAGKVLAQALVDKSQGERPVTLIGFSMGARVVYSCLEELAAQNAFGLVENAILIGSPVPSSELTWSGIRTVVSSRLINVFTTRDLILGYLYRTRNAQLNIAGLQAVNVPFVENKDISDIVSGHNQYRLAIGRILKELNFADIDLNQVEQENAELVDEQVYEKEVYDKAREEGQLEDFEDEQGGIKMTSYEHHLEPELDDPSDDTKHHRNLDQDISQLKVDDLAENEPRSNLPPRPGASNPD